jgi:alpha-glucosidase
VPIPWSGSQPPFGFSPPDATAPPWLPQPGEWKTQSVEAEAGDPDSMLELYHAALRLRRHQPGLGDGPLEWLDAPDGVLSFARGPGFICVVNVDARPQPPPEGAALLITSGPLTPDRSIPADTAAWLTR